MCTDVTQQEAADVGDRLRGWLFREGILLPDLDAEDAHPAGPRAAQACAGGCCQPGESQHQFGTANIIVGRNIYWSEWGHNLYCPVCEFTVEPEDDEVLEAMRLWQLGEPSGDVSCPDCGLRKSLTDWDSDWGYGNLGIEFWGWPSLAYSFVHTVRRITESRVTVAHGGRG